MESLNARRDIKGILRVKHCEQITISGQTQTVKGPNEERLVYELQLNGLLTDCLSFSFISQNLKEQFHYNFTNVDK